jgi:CBS domain containing-hemolysin-like protein
MDDGSWLSIAALTLLLVCAIYFAVAETAFASVTRPKIKARQERGDLRAKNALWILDNFDRAITTILIGTNIVHLSAAAIVTLLVTKHWGTGAVIWGTIATTLVLFYAGEMLPKTIAKRYSEPLCLTTAGLLRFFMGLFKPLALVLTAIGQSAAKLTKGDGEVSVTEDELYDIIEDMTDAGSLDEEQGDLVQSALEFADVTVEHVLTARVDMAAVDADWPLEKITQFIQTQRHSRLPVYEGQIDNIIGILQIRKFIKAWLAQGQSLDLRSLLDKPYFVPASTNVDALLPEMSRNRLNMAVVTDPWGGTLGIVTVEDIVEELVGEIWDEEDVVEEYFHPLGGGRYELDARLDVAEAFELLGFEDPEDDEELVHKSLTEWALEQFDLMPAQRDKFVYHGLEFTLSDVRQHRIRKLTVRRLPDSTQPGGESA